MNKFFSKVFMWMFVGLLVTFITGYVIVSNPDILYMIVTSNIYYFAFILEFIVVIFMSARIRKMSNMMAIASFIIYAFINGITLSVFFVLFTTPSIIFIFLITAITFLVFAVIGNYIKTDLSRFGIYLIMALFGIIILYVINVFFFNETLNLIACSIGIVVFCLYIAFDVQRIKKLDMGMEHADNLAIFWALQLYLDFINILIKLLSIFGKRKN